MRARHVTAVPRRRRFGVRVAAICVVVAGVAGGCSDGDDERRSDAGDASDASDPTAGRTLGQTCDHTTANGCRFGLECVDDTCVSRGDAAEDALCISTMECGPDLFCASTGRCTPAGGGDAGALCATTADCRRGLVCDSLGFAGVCAEAGAADVGATCARPTDCAAGLRCGEAATCAAGSLAFGWSPWEGADCLDEGADVGPPRVYFEVPRDGAPLREFFRLPFPNDIRRRDDRGGVDLTGFPTPGPGLLGFDLVARLVAAGETQDGFALVPTIYFRFSTPFDLATVWADGVEDPPPGEPTLYLLDITPGSPTWNDHPHVGYHLSEGRDRYICRGWIGVKPAWETPLAPDTTYAVILASGVRHEDGALLVADADFPPLLAATRPSGDPALARAWDIYAPLRAYLASPDARLPAERVLAAAVFTTRDPTTVTAALRPAVRAAPAPVPADVTLCDAGVASPCDDGLAGTEHVRGCFAADPAVHELHMRVPLPVIQAGTRPYLDPADGGDVARGPDGAIAFEDTEAVCVSVTIPRGLPMPAEGWPLVIYGHGTGGTFRSAVQDLGHDLADVALEAGPRAGAHVGAAVVGWEAPMHGERRGTPLPPELLYFSARNPAAARGNAWQGAADLFALVHAFEGLAIAAADSPTGEAIRFDARAVVHVGHSQGAATGGLASPFEPAIAADVWSGAGGGLVQGLLHKTRPLDAHAAVALALGEYDDEGGLAPIADHHPVMGLVQHVFGPVDPLGYAALAIRSPPAGGAAHHVLHVHGVGDRYTPWPATRSLARVLGVHQAIPVLAPLGGPAPQVAPPVRANVTRDGRPITAVFVQAEPAAYDGHFVMTRDAGVRRQLVQFVATAVADGVPTLVAR